MSMIYGRSATTGKPIPVACDASGYLMVSGGLATDRADTARSAATLVLTVQPIDATGAIISGGQDIGTTGSAVPTKASQAAGTDGTNLRALSVDTSGRLKLANYVDATVSTRCEEIDPIDQKYLAETMAAVTNGTDGTYYYYLDLAGYTQLAVQGTISGGSGTCDVTTEGTLQDDGTAPASCTYADIGLALFNDATAGATFMWNDLGRVAGQFKYIRIKVVAATGGANDADWTLFSKMLY